MRVYLSGPMTGRPDHNIPAFSAAAERLRAEGHFVVNPAELSALFGSAHEIARSFSAMYGEIVFGGPPRDPELARSIMSADLAAVRSCDAIYLLKGWEESKGARAELAVALQHGKQILLEGAGE